MSWVHLVRVVWQWCWAQVKCLYLAERQSAYLHAEFSVIWNVKFAEFTTNILSLTYNLQADSLGSENSNNSRKSAKFAIYYKL